MHLARPQHVGLAGGGRGHPFLPSRLSGVAEWYDTDDPTKWTLGAASIITDCVGSVSGLHGAPAVGGSEPKLLSVADSPDGIARPAIKFNKGLVLQLQSKYAGLRALTFLCGYTAASANVLNTTTVLAAIGAANAIDANGRNALARNAEGGSNPASFYPLGRGGGSTMIGRSEPLRAACQEPCVVMVRFVQSASGLADPWSMLRIDNVDVHMRAALSGTGISPDVFANEAFAVGSYGDGTFPATDDLMRHPMIYTGTDADELAILHDFIASRIGGEATA